MSKIQSVLPYAPIAALQITVDTARTDVSNLLFSTPYDLNISDGTILLSHETGEHDEIELGDYLVRIGKDVHIYAADEFHQTFLAP